MGEVSSRPTFPIFLFARGGGWWWWWSDPFRANVDSVRVPFAGRRPTPPDQGRASMAKSPNSIEKDSLIVKFKCPSSNLCLRWAEHGRLRHNAAKRSSRGVIPIHMDDGLIIRVILPMNTGDRAHPPSTRMIQVDQSDGSGSRYMIARER